MTSEDREKVQLEPATTFVVYDQRSGEIVLLHHFSSLPGVPLPDALGLESMALQHAAEGDSRDAGELAAIQVSPDEIAPQTQYRVSLSDRKLVAMRRDAETP